MMPPFKKHHGADVEKQQHDVPSRRTERASMHFEGLALLRQQAVLRAASAVGQYSRPKAKGVEDFTSAGVA